MWPLSLEVRAWPTKPTLLALAVLGSSAPAPLASIPPPAPDGDGYADVERELARLSLAPRWRARAASEDAMRLAHPDMDAPAPLAGDTPIAVATALRRLGPAPGVAGPAPSPDHRRRPAIVAAITAASRATGISRSFLLRTAERESGLNPFAISATSTARGLFQFTEGTWLELVSRHGPPGGAHTASRATLLAKRYDADIAATMAGLLARENTEHLTSALGRRPTEGDLYVAHFLGASGAVRLILAARQTPHLPAARLLPAAARANPSVFFNGSRPRGCAELLAQLRHG